MLHTSLYKREERMHIGANQSTGQGAEKEATQDASACCNGAAADGFGRRDEWWCARRPRMARFAFHRLVQRVGAAVRRSDRWHSADADRAADLHVRTDDVHRLAAGDPCGAVV